MNTGGTADIVEDEVTGLLSDDAAGLAEDVRRIRHGEVLRQRLGAAAAQRGRPRSSTAPAVVARIEALYRDVIAGAARVSRSRVAITARSVFPLHGHGGLERSVYDLARHLAAKRRRTSR